MFIPKIIHQTWKEKPLPPVFELLAETWKCEHPDWEYKLWTDDDNRKLIEESFPYFLHTYDNYSLNIQRADAVRYFILYKYGGVYVDIDFECFKNIGSLLGNDKLVFIYQPAEHCKWFNMDKIICNAFMASAPNHNFLRIIIEDMLNNISVIEDPNDRVLHTTGPFMVTRVFDSAVSTENIRILSPEALYPLTSVEVRAYIQADENADPILQEKLEHAYGVHYWLNTWTDWAAFKRKSTKLQP